MIDNDNKAMEYCQPLMIGPTRIQPYRCRACGWLRHLHRGDNSVPKETMPPSAAGTELHCLNCDEAIGYVFDQNLALIMLANKGKEPD